MKLIDKLLSKFINKRKIKENFNDPVNELFQPSLKEEYISLGTWNTYSYFNSEKFENKIDDKEEPDYTIFENELKHLINRYSKENGSDTPDFILAEYLNGCIEIFDKTVKRRDEWYGRVIPDENNNDCIL